MTTWWSLPARAQRSASFVALLGASAPVALRADGSKNLETVISGITEMVNLSSEAGTTGFLDLTPTPVASED